MAVREHCEHGYELYEPDGLGNGCLTCYQAEVERLRAFIDKTAREHCHCDLDPGPCSVCRARGEVVAR